MRRSRSPILLGLAVAATLAWLTVAFHPIEVDGAENDHFVQQADRLLRGEPFLDGYHPVGYPLAIALLARVLGGDTWLAARLLSALASGGIVLATMAIARRLGGALHGTLASWLAGIATALCAPLLLLGLQAASDPLGTALALAATALLLRAADGGGARTALFGGLAFGLALAVRTSNLAFAPVLLLPLLRRANGSAAANGANDRTVDTTPPPPTARLATIAMLAFGIAIGFLPHAIAANAQLGSPFANENWRNLALKLDGFRGDVLALRPHATIGDVLPARLGELLHRGASDAAALLPRGLGDVLAPGLPSPLGAAIGAIALLALAALLRAPRTGGPVAAAAFAVLGLVCVAFVPTERLLLPVLPLLFVGLGVAAARTKHWFGAPAALALLTAVLAGIAALPARFAAFCSAHPTAEVEAAQQLARSDDNGNGAGRIAASYASVGRHLAVPSSAVWHAGPGRMQSSADAIAHLRLLRRKDGAERFVVGSRTYPELHALLRRAPLPAGFHRLRADDDVVVIATDPLPADRWIVRTEVTPTEWRAGALSLTVIAHDDAPLGRVRTAVAEVLGPEREAVPCPLTATADGRYRAALDAKTHALLPHGRYRIVPVLQLDDGSARRGPPVYVQVE